MATTITTRLDDRAEQRLNHLTTATGKSRSDVVREALAEAERQLILAEVRRESEGLMNDPADRAELAAVHREMEALRAW